MVGVGESDAMDYHALEAMQSMVERRRGGETGVRAVQFIEGPAVWKAGQDGRWSRRLLEAALSRSTSRSGIGMKDGRTQDWTHSGELEQLVANPAAYLIEYNDGLRATLLMINGAVRIIRLPAGCATAAILSTQFLLPVTAERGLLDVPDARGRRDDHHGPRPLPRPAHADCVRHPGPVSRFEGWRAWPIADARAQGTLQGPRRRIFRCGGRNNPGDPLMKRATYRCRIACPVTARHCASCRAGDGRQGARLQAHRFRRQGVFARRFRRQAGGGDRLVPEGIYRRLHGRVQEHAGKRQSDQSL